MTPSLHVEYKNAKIKQYHKLGKAIGQGDQDRNHRQ